MQREITVRPSVEGIVIRVEGHLSHAYTYDEASDLLEKLHRDVHGVNITQTSESQVGKCEAFSNQVVLECDVEAGLPNSGKYL